MRKIICLVLPIILVATILAGCSSNDENNTKQTVNHNIGETVSTDSVELKIQDVSYGKYLYRDLDDNYLMASNDPAGKYFSVDGFAFVSIQYTVKNIGKTTITQYVPSSENSISGVLSGMFSLDYNNGYKYYVVDVFNHVVSCTFGDNIEAIESFSDLVPLTEAKTYRTVIQVPEEVITQTDNNLLLNVNVPNSESYETISFTLR